jgi:hypothetical protein
MTGEGHILIALGCGLAALGLAFRVQFNKSFDVGQGMAAMWFIGLAFLLVMLGAFS